MSDGRADLTVEEEKARQERAQQNIEKKPTEKERINAIMAFAYAVEQELKRVDSKIEYCCLAEG